MDQGIMTLITAGMVVVAAAFVLWLLYSVIWRAVRRGLREYERQTAVAAPGRFASGLRSDPRQVVPDYPPREWV